MNVHNIYYTNSNSKAKMYNIDYIVWKIISNFLNYVISLWNKKVYPKFTILKYNTKIQNAINNIAIIFEIALSVKNTDKDYSTLNCKMFLSRK